MIITQTLISTDMDTSKDTLKSNLNSLPLDQTKTKVIHNDHSHLTPINRLQTRNVKS